MGERRGRPVKEFSREYRCEVRLSVGDVYTLKYIMEKTGKNKSEIFRDALKLEYEKLRKAD